MSVRFRACVLVVSLSCLFAASEASGQTIWYVNAAGPCPGVGTQANPFCTIQAAITAAAANATPVDEIHVADGVYTGTGNKNLDFGGKKIKLIGVNGPANCIIDCQNSGRGFYFHTGETAASVVDGLTIRNGNVTSSSPGSNYGGGVYCTGASPTLTNCVISGNTATGTSSRGGGVYCMGPATTLSHCTISQNKATITGGSDARADGGGVYCANSTVLINCAILNNTASAVATTASNMGGGLYYAWAMAHGGGVYGGSSLTDCLIIGNTCTARITAMAMGGSLVAQGGGVYCGAGSGTTLVNCTTTRNWVNCDGPFAPTWGGPGVFTLSPSTLTSCIVWDDWIGGGPLSGSFTVTYSDVLYGYTGTGNISTDPGFVSSSSDFHLTPSSLCIDTGNPAFVPQPGERDLDGHLRVWDGNLDGVARVDMGAYEYGSIAPVAGDADCSGAGNGLDVRAFVLAMLDLSGYAAAYPNCDASLADMNGDTAVDAVDLQLFVDTLVGG